MRNPQIRAQRLRKNKNILRKVNRTWFCTNCKKDTAHKSIFNLEASEQRWFCGECLREDTHPANFSEEEALRIFFTKVEEGIPETIDLEERFFPVLVDALDAIPEANHPKHVSSQPAIVLTTGKEEYDGKQTQKMMLELAKSLPQLPAKRKTK